MLLQPRDYRNALLPAWGARQISKLLGLQWKMRGQQNIVGDTGCIVLINHQSGIDLLVLAELWPVMKKCTVISKREVFYLWPFGLASWLWGTVFIDRVNGPRAQETINKTAETINSKKAKICMFPEGTRHGGSQLLPFKKGAFHVAITSQVPIQPVVVSRYSFLNSDQLIFDKGSSVISILPPIETKGLSKDNIGELMKSTYTIMAEEYHRLNQSN
ncbi:hypothetical protein AAG570_011336 [Ranatra chinensis]|uniref:1-acyl-sn-glycerol-3-phosphate acyltransferase n=1 Tax=Ranatra chinensis TaxID=642074 RepID=A0ABD0Z6K3_9HEMI